MKYFIILLIVLCVSVFCSHNSGYCGDVADKVVEATEEITEAVQGTAKVGTEVVSVVVQKLDALAEGLGTTAKYLWKITVKQAYVMAVTNLSYCIFLAGFVIGYVKFIKYACKGELYSGRDCEGVWVLTIVCGVAIAILTAVCATVAVPEAITCVFNPEYWAFKTVLEGIR
jgi:hypothetical protein